MYHYPSFNWFIDTQGGWISLVSSQRDINVLQ